MISGESGSGKTTLLERATYDWARDRLWNERFDLILLIRLNDVPATAANLEEVLQCGLRGGHSHWKSSLPDFVRWLQRPEQQQRVLWIFDGWESVTLHPRTILHDIALNNDVPIVYAIFGSRISEAISVIKV
jgi:predicted NACHT family NTPase